MNRFLSPLDCRLIRPDPEVWMLLSDLVFESEKHGPIVAEAGFTTDFTSVPRLPVIFFMMGGFCKEEAVIHDYLYAFPGCLSRKDCDDIFLEAMVSRGVSEWRRKGMYKAVRMFGAWHFARDGNRG